ncbi:Fasciclin-1 [Hypsibius exemplaris]|uniref:Fasciclin-1 n=1 Tax=Hypsibius exemplaris TaxID=2072580 RepID=A0A1W0WA78_HYPEX|nr:Fasciclin-1 [Hypsibius exemplaris]
MSPPPWRVNGFFCLILHGLLAVVAPQGLQQLLAANGLTEFQKIINASFATQGMLTNPTLALTVFAPTNDAIARWMQLTRQKTMSSDLLQNHIAPGTWTSIKLMETARAPNKLDRRITSGIRDSPLWLKHFSASIRRLKQKLYINDALVLSDQPFQSGVHFLYIIDEVLAPTGALITARAFLQDPVAQQHSDLALEELQLQVERTAQLPALQDSTSVATFFLPNNAAFSSLKNRDSFDVTVFKGHVIPDEVIFLRSIQDSLSDFEPNRKPPSAFPSLLDGGGPAVDSFVGFSNLSTQQQVFSLVTKGDSRFPNGRVYANIVKANIPVANGVLHIIDRILLVVDQDAKEVIESRPDLASFRALFNFADPKLLERLSDDTDLTIFVPTNAALAALPRDKLGRLKQDRHLADKILNLHLLPNRLTSDKITNVTTALTSVHQRLTFQVRPSLSDSASSQVTVEGEGVSARIVEPDLTSTNAVIHVIDQLLGIPFMNAMEKLRGEPNLSKTYKAFEQTRDLNSALTSSSSNYTVFAPSDQAWANMDLVDRNTILSKPKLLARVMKRHLVEGRRMETTSLRKEDRYTATPSDVLIKRGKDSGDTLLSWKGHSAKITTYDISAVNGIIHVIDQVLFDKEIDLINSSPSVVSIPLLSVIVLSCLPLLSVF